MISNSLLFQMMFSSVTSQKKLDLNAINSHLKKLCLNNTNNYIKDPSKFAKNIFFVSSSSLTKYHYTKSRE